MICFLILTEESLEFFDYFFTLAIRFRINSRKKLYLCMFSVEIVKRKQQLIVDCFANRICYVLPQS